MDRLGCRRDIGRRRLGLCSGLLSRIFGHYRIVCCAGLCFSRALGNRSLPEFRAGRRHEQCRRHHRRLDHTGQPRSKFSIRWRNNPAHNLLAHPVEVIDTRLQQTESRIVETHAALIDAHEQALQLMAEITHRYDPGHAGPAFQGVQVALQLRQWGRVVTPGSQRADRTISFGENLARLFIKNGCYLSIELRLAGLQVSPPRRQHFPRPRVA